MKYWLIILNVLITIGGLYYIDPKNVKVTEKKAEPQTELIRVVSKREWDQEIKREQENESLLRCTKWSNVNKEEEVQELMEAIHELAPKVKFKKLHSVSQKGWIEWGGKATADMVETKVTELIAAGIQKEDIEIKKTKKGYGIKVGEWVDNEMIKYFKVLLEHDVKYIDFYRQKEGERFSLLFGEWPKDQLDLLLFLKNKKDNEKNLSECSQEELTLLKNIKE